MTTETFFQLHYHLTDTEGLFDLAQGIAVQRRRLKKHDAQCRSFRWFSRRLLWQGAVLLALGAVLLWLTASLALGRASGALTGLCFGCGVLELVLCALMQRNYWRGWRQFQQQNDPDGCILFDGGGIREENRKGKPGPSARRMRWFTGKRSESPEYAELVKKGRRPFLTKEFSLRPARFHA